MRVDARSLLERLGKRDFAYREFAGRFSDLELWPLFEAVLHDPEMALVHEPPVARDLPSSPSVQPATSPFSRYDRAPSAPPLSDVRTMFRNLSDLAREGGL